MKKLVQIPHPQKYRLMFSSDNLGPKYRSVSQRKETKFEDLQKLMMKRPKLKGRSLSKFKNKKKKVQKYACRNINPKLLSDLNIKHGEKLFKNYNRNRRNYSQTKNIGFMPGFKPSYDSIDLY
mmetsp:Transcript_14322/g.12628  ORF Transcript_14322/g.12628 Transcript_14322/m.12628 type:complete len:123 (-) Transcript_14322:8-376(-)